MQKFKTPPNRQICFIDTKEIAAIVPCKILYTDGSFQGSKILLRGGGEVEVYGNPEEVKLQEDRIMNTYRVVFIHQNIESGGSTRYRFVRTFEAVNEVSALEEGLKRLGCNLDGKLYSSTVTRIEL